MDLFYKMMELKMNEQNYIDDFNLLKMVNL